MSYPADMTRLDLTLKMTGADGSESIEHRTVEIQDHDHYSCDDERIGLRIGEILASRWGRIDLLRGTLRVAKTCYQGHFGSPKTRASRREVPLAPAVVRELKTSIRVSRTLSREALVFANSQSLPLAADNLRKKALRTACKRAGLQRIDWHTLRHTRHCCIRRELSFESCTGSAWTFTYGDNFGDLYTRQWECTTRRCKPARRTIVPKLENCGSIAKKESQLVQ